MRSSTLLNSCHEKRSLDVRSGSRAMSDFMGSKTRELMSLEVYIPRHLTTRLSKKIEIDRTAIGWGCWIYLDVSGYCSIEGKNEIHR